MSRLSYLIVSTPRSGTRYAARLLSAAGLQCGHEQAFGFRKLWSEVGWRLERNDREGVWGDSSWLAAPFLDQVPEDVAIIYQMRNPLDTIRSIIRQNLTTEPYVKPGQFAWEQTPNLRGSDSVSDVMVKFWCGWHERIQAALRNRDNVYAIRVEDWDGDAVWRLAGHLEEGVEMHAIGPALNNRTENARPAQAAAIVGDWASIHGARIADLVYRFMGFEGLG